jgi:Domain of unknown function (DUF4389)
MARPAGIPEWPKGAGCKPAGSAFGGSNPPPCTVRGCGICECRFRTARIPKARQQGCRGRCYWPVGAEYTGPLALLAQSVEHLHGKEGVDGSSPSEGFQNPCSRGFFVQEGLFFGPACLEYGAVHGASKHASPPLPRERGDHDLLRQPRTASPMDRSRMRQAEHATSLDAAQTRALSYGALGTDRYPPFTLKPVPDYPAIVEVQYPERLSRGLVLVKWWLLAIPHYLILGVLLGGGGYAGNRGWDGGDEWSYGGSPGLVLLLVIFAAVALLFTRRYPRGIFDFVIGLDRWVLRVVGYAALMTDAYPPFRLDQGGDEPGTSAPEGPPRRPHSTLESDCAQCVAGLQEFTFLLQVAAPGLGGLRAERLGLEAHRRGRPRFRLAYDCSAVLEQQRRNRFGTGSPRATPFALPARPAPGGRGSRG